MVVVDPIDGSLNAKRSLPFYCISIAFADGPTLDDVRFGYVLDLGSGEEWVADRGRRRDGQRAPAGRRAAEGAAGHRRLRGDQRRADRRGGGAAGRRGRPHPRAGRAGAGDLPAVADGRLDGVASLKQSRSVDVAAAALIVREAGGHVPLPTLHAAAARPDRAHAHRRGPRRGDGDAAGRPAVPDG